ncbi:MAG: OmpA family protein [Candidatus Omnitrophota bacterium]|nr:OmpA family protein [Candidatus Omnitrophota bacterium]
MKIRNCLVAVLLAMTLIAVPGCAKNRKKLTDLESQVQELQQRLNQAEGSRQALQKEMENLRAQLRRQQEAHQEELDRLAEKKEEESNELLDAQRALADSLRKELGDARAKLQMTERGLVLTLLDEIFFDSGKAVIKEEGLQTLNKVAQVLQETVPDSPVAVEGHTDNDPIKYSSWRTNWELSSGRALAVLHHFADQGGVAPERLQAVAMGEFHPVSSNDTAEGRRQNRRVEIVILPTTLKKVKE